MGKLLATDTMARTSEVARMLLGRDLTADAGRWGTWAWSEHVLGAPGYRIAGGTDEIQHNIFVRAGARPAAGAARMSTPSVPTGTTLDHRVARAAVREDAARRRGRHDVQRCPADTPG